MRVNSNNGVTPTSVLRYIDSQLGSTVQMIELSSKEIMRIVFQQSLQTFSQYFPFLPMVSLSEEYKIDANRNEYRLPNPWNLQILNIHKYVLCAESRFGGGWIAPFLNNPVDSQILNDRMSEFMTPLTIDFWPPNRVVIRQSYYDANNQISIVFKAVHPSHMKSIQSNLRDDFFHLCLYDVLLALYPIRHRFQTINTTYGSLEPFFEMVDSAKDNRDNLLQKWRDSFISSGETKKLWIV